MSINSSFLRERLTSKSSHSPSVSPRPSTALYSSPSPLQSRAALPACSPATPPSPYPHRRRCAAFSPSRAPWCSSRFHRPGPRKRRLRARTCASRTRYLGRASVKSGYSPRAARWRSVMPWPWTKYFRVRTLSCTRRERFKGMEDVQRQTCLRRLFLIPHRCRPR